VLHRPGALVMDLFGGAGGRRANVQRVRVDRGHVDRSESQGIPPFTYVWEQSGVDPLTSRMTCRIHFEMDDGTVMSDAFVYDWRMWEVADVVAQMKEAGFGNVVVWCDGYDEARGTSDGSYRPVDAGVAAGRLGNREDFVAYVVGLNPA